MQCEAIASSILQELSRDMCFVVSCNRLLNLYTLQLQSAFVVRDALQICAIATLASCALNVFYLPGFVERPSHGARIDFQSILLLQLWCNGGGCLALLLLYCHHCMVCCLCTHCRRSAFSN